MSRSFTPRPYQKLITRWMLEHKRVGIWAFMGAGKTSATLDFIATLHLFDPSPVLIIAPLLVARDVWSDERDKWEDFSHLRVSTIIGSLSDRLRAIRTPADLYTVNFEQLPWLINYFGEKWPFKTVIVDECSKLRGFKGSEQISKNGKIFIRSGGTKRSSCLAKIAHTKIERFIGLTGTPASNGLKTLWGPMWFLDKGKCLGRTFQDFSMRWFVLGYDGFTLLPLPHAEKEIMESVSDVCFSLVAKDWFDLKEPVVNNIEVRLPLEAKRLYDDMEKDMYAEINTHGIEAVNAGVKRIKCSQMANGAIYTDDKHAAFETLHDAKIKALERIIEEAVGMPVLVVYEYRHDLERLLKAFPQGKALDKNKQTVRDWNKGKIPLMFLHAASAGHGNNFQDGGNIIVYFGVGVDLELYMQVLERIGPVRQLQSGYNRPVFVHHLIAKDTTDELDMKRIQTKRSIQDLLLEEAAKRR